MKFVWGVAGVTYVATYSTLYDHRFEKNINFVYKYIVLPKNKNKYNFVINKSDSIMKTFKAIHFETWIKRLLYVPNTIQSKVNIIIMESEA